MWLSKGQGAETHLRGDQTKLPTDLQPFRYLQPKKLVWFFIPKMSSLSPFQPPEINFLTMFGLLELKDPFASFLTRTSRIPTHWTKWSLKKVFAPLEEEPLHIVTGWPKFPSTVTMMGNSAFEDWRFEKMPFRSCSELSWITLPPNLEASIEEGTFEYCSALTHVRMSPNVTFIGCREESNPSTREPNAISGCTSLLSLELPEGLETIELLVFNDDEYEWSSLVNLYLPL